MHFTCKVGPKHYAEYHHQPLVIVDHKIFLDSEWLLERAVWYTAWPSYECHKDHRVDLEHTA